MQSDAIAEANTLPNCEGQGVLCSKDLLAGVKRRKPLSREAIMRRSAKIVAAKLAKRIVITCKICGKQWKEKPSHSWRKYCSRACMKVAATKAKEYPCPRCGKLSYRRPSTAHAHCADCIGLNLSERNKARGINPYSTANKDTESKRLAKITSAENRGNGALAK